ncbi:MAG: hypothetical protein POH28_01905 [Acidocella sp.]|nr:hypothetical protein [Acidocella sp.]
MRILRWFGVKSLCGLGAGLLMLSGCAKPPAPLAAVAPPAPVGHVYPTVVAVPPPPSRHIRITPAQAAQVQQAFNVIALKSALMVGALSCNQQSRYDAFMNEFQPHILADQHVMDAYFHRIDGYAGQAREDDFVTLLANNQSVSGISEGNVFCLNNDAEFDAVLSLKTPSDLDHFVTDRTPGPGYGTIAAAVR